MAVKALADGEYRLHAEVEKVKTSFQEMPLRVTLDTPPKFERVAGLSVQVGLVRPKERCPISCAVSDDFGIAEVALELRINDRPATLMPLKLKGAATPHAEGDLFLDLGGLVEEGDRVAYRLTATDNRDIPEAKLSGQKSHYPADGRWVDLRVDRNAAPLEEQEIAARKKDIAERLQAIQAALLQEQRELFRFKIDNAKANTLKPAEVESLAEIRRNVTESAVNVEELAKEVALTSELNRLAEGIRAVSEQDLRPAIASIRQAHQDDKSEPRGKNLSAAESSLENACRKIAILLQANERVAQARLTRRQLEELANQQKELADKTGIAEPSAPEELSAKQQELADRLSKLQQENEPLRQAIAELKRQQFDRAANEAQRLEQELRELTDSMKSIDQVSREMRLADLLERQQDLRDRARELGESTAAAARAGPVSPLKLEEIDRATAAVREGNLGDAVEQQERAAFELGRLATELETAVARARDRAKRHASSNDSRKTCGNSWPTRRKQR